MPRSPSGPRRIDQSGTFYAVRTIRGKRHHISLKTKVKSEAMRLWPAAQAELEALAEPPKYIRGREYKGTVMNDAGELVEGSLWAEDLARDEFLVDEDDPTIITWDKAIEVAAKRFRKRRGKPFSYSTQQGIEHGLKHLQVKHPLAVKPANVRQMVDRMEDLGYSDSTIATRASSVSGVLDALIRAGYTSDDYQNPFNRVDTSATSTNHFYKPTPEDYRLLWKADMSPADRELLKVLMFTGVRLGEAFNGIYSDGQLEIKVLADWRPKNKASERTIPLPEGVGEKAIEVGRHGFREHWNKFRHIEEITPHSLRHGWKTAAREAGADEITSERYLGHKIPKMALTYGEFSQTVLRREAEKVWEVINSWIR